MLEEKLVTEINQALRKSIARQRELVHKMDTLEVIDSVKNLLSATIASMNDLRKKNALIDYDVIKAFRILVGDIRNFNEYKGKEVVPVPGKVKRGAELYKPKIDKVFFSVPQTKDLGLKTPPPTPKLANPKKNIIYGK